MARVTLSPRAAAQIDRCRDFYSEGDPAIGVRAITAILAAFKPLTRHPMIGRPVPEDASLRELVIPFGHHGYVALYKFSPETKTVMILAVRHQREAGYHGQAGKF